MLKKFTSETVLLGSSCALADQERISPSDTDVRCVQSSIK